MSRKFRLSPLRILFVTPYVPSRMRIRPLAFIRELARHGHEVTLVCLAQPAEEIQYLEEVAQYCQEVRCIPVKKTEAYLNSLLSLPTKVPISVAYCKSSAAKKTINQIITKVIDCKEWDLIHTEFIRAVPYTETIREIPKIFDAVDSLSLAYQRSLSAPYLSWQKRATAWFELVKMKHYEPEVVKYYDRVLVSSPRDRMVLTEDHLNVLTLPNGVDLDYFTYSECKRDQFSIVFLGKMNYYVNVSSVLWFYNQVFPIIRKKYPQAKFKIVGRNPNRAIRMLSEDSSVEVTGTVADVRPHLANAAVAIGPMLTGSGIQNKILEAMSVGTPCVTTSFVSQALQVQPGRELLVADLADEFARCIIELIGDDDKRSKLGWNGRKYVERYHKWENIGTQLINIYTDLLHTAQR